MFTTLYSEILVKRVRRATPDEAPTIHRYADPADQFYGDRLARGADPCGNQLFIASNATDVEMDGLMKRLVPLC